MPSLSARREFIHRDPVSRGGAQIRGVRYSEWTGHKNRGNDFAAVTILCMRGCIRGLRSTCITRATPLAPYAARDSRGQQIPPFADAIREDVALRKIALTIYLIN